MSRYIPPTLKKTTVFLFSVLICVTISSLSFSTIAGNLGIVQSKPEGNTKSENKILTLLVGQAMPPYICPDNKHGLELELVSLALALEGYQVQPKRMPLARIPRALNTGQADGALTLSEELPLDHVYFSDIHISYQNAFFSLKKFNIHLDSMEHLPGKSLVAFQNAQHYLGKQFQQFVANSNLYQEHHDQATQVAMLLKERTQLVVMDKHIFNYYLNQLQIATSAEVNPSDIRIHDILPASPYRVGFLRDSWRQAFNRGLAELKRRGVYREIHEKYLNCAEAYVRTSWESKSAPDTLPQQADCPC